MTFLEQLQAHKGGLIQLKTQLYWHEGQMWDNTPGRICLILDAAANPRETPAACTAATDATAAYFLIDGQTAWIWLAEEDIELLVNDQPIN